MKVKSGGCGFDQVVNQVGNQVGLINWLDRPNRDPGVRSFWGASGPKNAARRG